MPVFPRSFFPKLFQNSVREHPVINQAKGSFNYLFNSSNYLLIDYILYLLTNLIQVTVLFLTGLPNLVDWCCIDQQMPSLNTASEPEMVPLYAVSAECYNHYS